jgi:hypothetical protein
MNEQTPLLLVQTAPKANNGSIATTGTDESNHTDLEIGQQEGTTTAVPAEATSQPSTTATTTTPAVVTGQGTDGIVTKQKNIPIIELLALTAIISGSLSMYWGVTGFVLGTTTSSIVSVVVALLSQPIVLVHVVMSTCVVVLAPVVTVQKVQLHALGTLREQQNELRTQINTLNHVNDELTKSVSSVIDESDKIDQINIELQQFATTAGTTSDRLIELCTEQETIRKQICEHLQTKILQQIVTIALQSDKNQNYIVSEEEVNVLLERLKQIPGIALNESAFRSVLEKSDPKGSLTISDICNLARNLQGNKTKNNKSTAFAASDDSIEINEFGDPVFVFQPNDIPVLVQT